MERDEKDLRDTKNSQSEQEASQSLVVCLKTTKSSEKDKKKLISVGEVMIIMMNHKNRHSLECYALCVTLLYIPHYIGSNRRANRVKSHMNILSRERHTKEKESRERRNQRILIKLNTRRAFLFFSAPGPSRLHPYAQPPNISLKFSIVE